MLAGYDKRLLLLNCAKIRIVVQYSLIRKSETGLNKNAYSFILQKDINEPQLASYII